ncbi:glycosyltransferase family 2 protein [Oerskovia turbata]|uniref:Glycosyltransferase family 2 protein n=1 Tax=Oerskovia turbata TaxID=1713 RepID=A0A4V1N553_9CELL|nr:glycosyltransferase family 2 protein [Oerskovia turbata]RXR26733.1 glycosyltransferase family 2 protein [Oerskovia turbata]RXR34466.1 glycosyltransferase family 2 protein [Oerskovia turbata]TGJ97745.1 glycosyltransferase family 2 protein [Actinotalea fermentans ATCC 43279 = JCM 9966 = DSM 3133]
MYKGARIAAVVPAYKEESMIRTVIDTMPEFVDLIVIVDDCSPDGTSEAVKSSDDPRVVLIRHEVNKGVGGAIVTGHRAAMERGADVDVVMAGDAQMDPAYLPDLLDQVTSGGFGFAKANRFFRPDSYVGMPRHRVFGNVVLSFMTKFASGYWHLFDPQNGYTAVRTSVLEKIDLDRVSERYSFENDLLIHLNVAGTSAVDVPIPAVYGNEVSSIRLGKVVPELMSLLFRGYWYRLWYRYVLWSFSPVALLLFTGLFLTFVGVVAGVWMIVATWNSTPATAGTVLLAVTPFVLGVQMLVSSLQLDIQESPKDPHLLPFE